MTLFPLLIAFVLGAALVFITTYALLSRLHVKKTADMTGRVQTAEAINREVREQLRQRDEELARVRMEHDTEKHARVEALTRLEETRKSFEEQKSLLELMKQEMTDTFNALSAAALKSTSEDFLRLASERIGKVMADTSGKLGEHKSAMEGMMKPLSEALRKYEEQIHSIERKRSQDYTSLDEQIKMLATTHRDLQKETGNLVSALRKPHIRGRWGEITLRNVVELAGMSSHCDFTEQAQVESGDNRLRPDMVIHLPGEREIVVDAKVSMEALLDLSSAASEETRKDALKRHASQVREQVNRLSSKSYWSQFSQSPELTVLFIGESALVAALEYDTTLMEESMSKKVLIATPTTLFALLSAVAYGWRQEQITKNAEEIAAIGKELYERIAVWSRHLSDMSSSLGKAVDSYNRAVGSLESRVLPSVRKFRELGAVGGEALPPVKQIDKTPRQHEQIEEEIVPED